MVTIYVINLARARERWRHISSHCWDVGLEIVRFEGVDGRQESHPLFQRYDDSLSQRWKGSSLSWGQLGCYASHYLVWEECVKLGKPVIILEDDAVIDPERLRAFLSQVDRIGPEFECIRLFRNHSKHYKIVPVRKIGSLDIVKYTKGPMRGTGYYLTPAAAEKFLKASQRWFLPVDMTMDRFWENGVECFGVCPPIVSSDPGFESTIGYEARREKRKVMVKVFREVFAGREAVAKLLHNVRFWLVLTLTSRYR